MLSNNFVRKLSPSPNQHLIHPLFILKIRALLQLELLYVYLQRSIILKDKIIFTFIFLKQSPNQSFFYSLFYNARLYYFCSFQQILWQTETTDAENKAPKYTNQIPYFSVHEAFRNRTGHFARSKAPGCLDHSGEERGLKKGARQWTFSGTNPDHRHWGLM